MSFGDRLFEEAARALNPVQRVALRDAGGRDPLLRRDFEWLLAQFRGDLGPELLVALVPKLKRTLTRPWDERLYAALFEAVSTPVLAPGELFREIGRSDDEAEGGEEG